jgi:malate dehydrogenase (oxaloacetate-decarboxylating)
MARTTAAYSAVISVRLQNAPGVLGALCTAIGEAGGNIVSLQGFELHRADLVDEDIVVNASDTDHIDRICSAIQHLEGVEVLRSLDRTFAIHEGGKLETVPTVAVKDNDDLSMAYTPGVARVSEAIAADPSLAFDLTIKKNTVAIVSDGSAVLGLGDIGPEAAMPVMEGKALLFKEFAGVDAFPVCLRTNSVDEIVETVERLSPVFGGINLEDIKAPGAFEVEARLRESLDIPVFHDDQHGTAIVVLAALENSLHVVGKQMSDLSVVITGAGAAGVAITKILQQAGVANLVLCDREGTIHPGRQGLNSSKQWLADHTNPEHRVGTPGEVLSGTDVFIGVSAPRIVTPEDVAAMNKNAIVFALANPTPEVFPEDLGDGAAVVATGRSDYPNQINNVLAFPGVFRGALDARATQITEGMKLAAARAIASVIPHAEITPTNIIPTVFDRRVAPLVAEAVAEAARAEGVCR